MQRYLFELQEADGSVMAEVLVHGDDAAGPVDEDGRSVSYGRPIALIGRKWRLKSAETTRRYVRITCIAAPMNSRAERSSNGGLGTGGISGARPVGLESESGIRPADYRPSSS
jgi:hypothetical protein